MSEVARIIDGGRVEFEVEQWGTDVEHQDSGATTLRIREATLLVIEERLRVVEKFVEGSYVGDACESGRDGLLALACLGEEAGELVEAMVSGDRAHALTEAVQVAQVALAIVEGLLNPDAPPLVDWRGREPERGTPEYDLAVAAASLMTAGQMGRAAIEVYDGERPSASGGPPRPFVHLPGRDF